MVGHVLQAKNEGKHSMGVFLDLSKAFDMLDHPVLIAKLERYGIRGNMLDWFKSYLSGRSLVAKISNSTNVTMYSKKYDIMFGTAKGSCLGPLLFVIFCNDIYMLPIMGKLILFADDTTLIETHRNKKFLDYAVCHDILLLMDWFMANKLTLNFNKTVAMNFWPGNKKGANSINIMDVNIPFVKSTRFLGVYLDKNLDWKYHSNQVYNKMQSNKQLLNISKNLMDLKTLIKIYYAHIHSHLNYGLIVWGSMLNKTSLNDLECLQKAYIHLVNRTKKSSPANTLFKRNGILKFSDMINLELQKFGFKLSRQDLPNPIDRMMNKKGGKKVHRYPTHNKKILNIQPHNSTCFNNSYLYKGLSIFMTARKSIKEARSLRVFIKEVKKETISKY